MNEEPKSIWKKSWPTPFLFRAWLVLAAATFLILLVIILFLPGGPRSLLDWVPASLFLLAASAAIATVFLSVWQLGRWLLCWRNCKRSLFALACLATLIALFYAEEDWRGRHNWNAFKHDWEIRGEKLDFKDFVPPVVPDELNFAMTPLIASSYDYILTRDGKKIPTLERPTNHVDRLRFDLGDADWHTNGTGDWAKGTLSNLQPWQELYRSLATKTNLFPVPAQPQTPAADVLLALSRYDKTIEELRQASQRPESRYPLDYATENPAEILLPHLWELKTSALLLRLRAVAELQNDQSEQALADVQLALRLTGAIRTEPIMISHLVRVAMTEIIIQPIYEGLARHQWSDAQLVALDTELAKFDFLADCQLVQKSEVAFTVSEIDYLRRHRNYGKIFTEMGVNHPGESIWENLNYHCAPSGWFFQSAVRNCRILMQYYPAVGSQAKTISPGKTKEAGDAEKSANDTTQGFDALEWFKKAFNSNNQDLRSSGNFLKKIAFAQSSVDLARTAIALERYRLAHGEYPESLDALTPKFIAEMPHDVIGGGPVKYRRDSANQFVLYSIGWNERDDGGVVVFGEGKTPAVDISQGDWVWRYPAK